MTINGISGRVERLEAQLTELTAELSGYDASELIPTHTFLELGFDSLFMTQLAIVFSKELNVPISFRQLFDEIPTLSSMAVFVDSQLPEETAPVAVQTPATLAPVQEETSEPATTQLSLSEVPIMPSVTPGNVSTGLAAVLAEQVNLMSQQLILLQQMRAGKARSATETKAEVPQLAVPSAPQASAEAVTEPQAKELIADQAAIKLPVGFGLDTSSLADKNVTPRQWGHIKRLVERYNNKTISSKRRTQADRAVHADPRTATGFNPLWKEMVYPLVVERSKGAHLWDVDGNQYIDILNGFGPNFFGHNAPFITDALIDQLQNSYEVGPQTPRAGEAARLLCELTGMDRVSWVNTGSEAVQAAIRISRTVTGRDKIVVFTGDYHGNFDEVLVRGTKSAKSRRTFPQAPGIPFDSVKNVLVLDYGEPEALEIIKQHAGEIAAVLVEPVQSRRPEWQPKEFLQELRQLTTDEGIVLVFDEVITGFRIRQGGAQEYFGIEADIATYGKIIGGGMPIGVVAGRARFMDTFDGGMWQYGDNSKPMAGVTFFAGTFVRHPLAITAAHASLSYLKTAGPMLQEGVNKRANKMATELSSFFKEEDVNIEVPQFASQMFIRNNEENELSTLMFYHMRDRGIHVLEGFPSYMTAAHTDEDVEKIVAAVKDSIYEMQADGLLAARADGGSADQRTAWIRHFELTDDQRHVWLASQMGDDASCAFNESDSVFIEGPLQREMFKKAVIDTLQTHEAFKLRFDPDGEFQWVDEAMSFEVEEIDLSNVAGIEQDNQIDAIFERKAKQPFALEKGPLINTCLIETGDDKHVFNLYCHHIVFDGYSAHIVIEEIMDRYKAALADDDFVPATVLPYSVYAHRTSAQNTDQQHSTTYWQDEYTDGIPALVELPTDRARQIERQYVGSTVQYLLDEDFSTLVRDTAKSLRVSKNTLLFAAYSMMISRLGDSQDFVIGVPVAGQAAEEIETVGYCVNMLPVRNKAAFDKPFGVFLRETHRHVLEAFDHQNYSLTDLLKDVPGQRSLGRLPLTEIVFNYSRYFSDIEVPGHKIFTKENIRHAVYYDLFFQIIDSQNEMSVYVDYSTALFDEATIIRWIEHYTALLKDIAADPEKALGDYTLGRAATTKLCGPALEILPEDNVASLFGAMAKATPEAPALTSDGHTLTYAEVNVRANQLAHLLVQKGVTQNDIIGIMLDRSCDMVISMLAVWKAGGAYLPLDPEFPVERLNYMIDDSGTKLVLSTADLSNLTADISADLLNVDEAQSDLERQPVTMPASVSIDGTTRAYILYTSGSTGKPKGVENTHGATVNFLKAMKDRPGLSATDKLLAITTISFDISILEIFLPLIVGGETIIASKDQAMDGFDIADLMEEHNITIFQATPVTWRLMLDCDWAGKAGLKALCGGEALPPALASELLGKTGELWNMYGPTETTVWSTCELISDPQNINVGTPILNTSLYVLNAQGRTVPPGVPGELWIGGHGVAKGYLGRPELTATRFREDPFAENAKKARMYGTGDRAVIRNDGKVTILGRKDNQVKVRGHRIELGELESVLGNHERVSQAAACVQPDHSGEPMLVAYIVCATGAEVTHSELRQFLRKSVPDYMVPQIFVELEALPLTNNNKIDRNALPSASAGGAQARTLVSPRTQSEQLIADIWMEILDVEEISVTDNFFELGGQSLQVVKMASLLRKQHGLRISPRAVIFETLEQLAVTVDRLAS